MFDTHKPHPLLGQVPLTVSPFVSIPTAITLPYTFRSVPSSLPLSVLSDDQKNGKAKFVKSSSGHAAHPDDITNACRNLQDHMSRTATADQQLLSDWENQISQRDLAEKRRVAPGWLDRDEKILEPTKASNQALPEDLLGGQSSNVSAPTMSPSREGEELDRLFGRLSSK